MAKKGYCDEIRFIPIFVIISVMELFKEFMRLILTSIGSSLLFLVRRIESKGVRSLQPENLFPCVSPIKSLRIVKYHTKNRVVVVRS